MTKLLEKAFMKASQRSEIDQNILGKWLLEELEADRKWKHMFAESEDILDELADEAIIAYKKGKTKKLDIKKL